MHKLSKIWKKGRITTILLIIVFLVGLGFILYPTVSDYWNYQHSSRAIEAYNEQVSTLDKEEIETVREEAQAYNETLLENPFRFRMTVSERLEYNKLLNISGNGIMGYIEIPTIGCILPIYHGTDEGVLQMAVGHLEGSSLPVGGESTHCILTGHRGLPSARLFTDLNKMQKGDVFMLKVLDETLTYEVDQISTVLPTEKEALEITEGEDYCTLVTCTPYGINTHRLLVRGYRIPNLKDDEIEDYESITTHWWMEMIVTTIIMVVLLSVIQIVRRKLRQKKKREESYANSK